MTNELEKQFFDTFGIEPKLECIKPSDERCNECGCCELKYPQITDTHYLKLICTLGSIYLCVGNEDDVKNHILKHCIRHKEDVKHQVRTLFEEG